MCVAIASQKLVFRCLDTYNGKSNDWLAGHIKDMSLVREAIWPVLEKLGTVKSNGAFYFLVPVPADVEELEAQEILARQFGVLRMHGTPFGAPRYLRLSYGSIPPQDILVDVERLEKGFKYLMELSQQRTSSSI